MPALIRGERVSRQGQLSLATSAVILDDEGRVLLTQRQDNGLWCLPGGIMHPGESVGEAVVREVQEETGLTVRPVHLIGVYSDPDLLVVYPEGPRQQPVVLCFRCEPVAGTLRLSEETVDAGFFPVDELPPIVEPHRQRLTDVTSGSTAAFIR